MKLINGIFYAWIVISMLLGVVSCGTEDEKKVIEPFDLEDASNVSDKIGNAYYYTDVPIVGVMYKCGSQSGETDEGGGFEFEEGESCTFYLLEKELFELRKVNKSVLENNKRIVEEDENIKTILEALSSTINRDSIIIDRDLVGLLVEANITRIPEISEEISRLLDVLRTEEEESISDIEKRLNVIVEKGNGITLTWEDTPHTLEKINWYDASAYCETLVLAGLSDWHLPIRSALIGLDIERLQYSSNSVYWTGDEHRTFEGSDFVEAYIVDFRTGRGVETGFFIKSSSSNIYARCVSNSMPEDIAPFSPEELLINDICTEYDILREGEIGYGTYQEALTHCQSINAQVPTIEEIRNIYDQNATHPENAVGLWTSTVSLDENNSHISVYFLENEIEQIPMLDEYGRSFLCIKKHCHN